MTFQVRYRYYGGKNGRLLNTHWLTEGRSSDRRGAPVEFDSALVAEMCVHDLVDELRSGEGGWIGLLMEAHVDVPEVDDIWVVFIEELAGSRRSVK